MLKRVYEYVCDKEFRFTIFCNRIHIINYDEIKSLSSSLIMITSTNSKIKIQGDNLVLNKLVEKEALIVGVVKNIEVIYE